MADDPEAIVGVDNVVSFEQFRTARTTGDSTLDDDELVRRAGEKIAGWKAAGTPSMTLVQEELFYASICAGASAMARDKIFDTLITVFGDELGGKRAFLTTWNTIAKDYAGECAQEARENTAKPELTPAEKHRVARVGADWS